MLGVKDDVLGMAGSALVAVSLLGLLDMRSGGLFVTAVIATPGLALMKIALHWRRRRLTTVQVWLLLREKHVVPFDRLVRRSGLEPERLMISIAAINRVAPEAYLLDPERGVIIDSRLRGRAVVVERCDGCGAPVNASISIGDAGSVVCTSCGAPVATSNQDLVERAFAEVASEEKSETLSAPAPASRLSPLYRLGIVIALVVALPIIAIGLSVAMLLFVPVVGGLIVWSVATRFRAPQTHWEPTDLGAYADESGTSRISDPQTQSHPPERGPSG